MTFTKLKQSLIAVTLFGAVMSATPAAAHHPSDYSIGSTSSINVDIVLSNISTRYDTPIESYSYVTTDNTPVYRVILEGVEYDTELLIDAHSGAIISETPLYSDITLEFESEIYNDPYLAPYEQDIVEGDFLCEESLL